MQSTASDCIDYYSILGIQRSSSVDEIKRAYRDKIKSNNKSEVSADSTKINEAYSVLSDASKRSMYDQYGAEGLSNSTNHSNNTLDALSHFLSGQSERPKQNESIREDKRISISVTLADLYKGATKSVPIKRPIICKSCVGSGCSELGARKTCSKCDGSGQETITNQLGPGTLEELITTCRTCNGKGKTLAHEHVCQNCLGIGHVQEQAEVEIPLDSTVFSRDTIIVRAKAGFVPDVAPGDLHVKVDVQTHPVYKRRGYDLLTKSQVSLSHALMGGDIVLTHLDGRRIVVRTTHQDILCSGNLLLVRDEGMPRKDGTRGNLYIILELNLPHALNIDEQNNIRKVFCEKPLKGDSLEKFCSPEILLMNYEELVENKSVEWTKLESKDGEVTPEQERISNNSYAHGQSVGRKKSGSSRRKSRTQQCETV